MKSNTYRPISRRATTWLATAFLLNPFQILKADAESIYQQVPANADFVLGAHQLGKHVKSLKGSAWWRLLTSSRTDSATLNAKDEAILSINERLFEKDAAFYMVDGGIQDLKAWVELYRFYNKFSVATSLSAPLGGSSNFAELIGPWKGELQAKIEKLLFPRFIMVADVHDAESIVRDIQKLEKSDAKTERFENWNGLTGSRFTADLQEVFDGLLEESEELSDEDRKFVKDFRKILEGKKVVCTLASKAASQIYISFGPDDSHLPAALVTGENLLSNPAFGFTKSKLADAGLMVTSFAESGIFEELKNLGRNADALDGIFEALNSSQSWTELAEALKKRFTEFAKIEQSSLDFIKTSDFNGVLSWKNGLNLELEGGIDSQQVDASKASQFQTYIHDPKVILGLSYVGNPAYTKVNLNYFEGLVSAIWNGIEDYMALSGTDAGLKQQFNLFTNMLKPSVLKIYQGLKLHGTEGLGSDHLIVFDLKGPIPNSLGLPDEIQDELEMVRFASVHDVASRAKIQESWKLIKDGFSTFGAVLAMFTGEEGGDLLSTDQFKTDTKDGVTYYTSPNLSFNESLTPTLAINDQYWAIASTPLLVDEVLQKVNANAQDGFKGAQWTMNLGKILQTAAIFGAQESEFLDLEEEGDVEMEEISEEAIEDVGLDPDQVLNLFKAFGRTHGKSFYEAGKPRQSIQIDLSDIPAEN